MRCTVVYEKAPKNYSAYVLELPGCIATGKTRQEVRERIREAIAFHLEGMQLDGDPMAEPEAWAEFIEVEPPVPAGSAQR